MSEIRVNPHTERREMTAHEVEERTALHYANTATALRGRIEDERVKLNGKAPPEEPLR